MSIKSINVKKIMTAMTHFDTLHGDVIDDADDAAGTGHGQQRVTGARVKGPRTSVEIFICLGSTIIKGITQELLHKYHGSRECQQRVPEKDTSASTYDCRRRTSP